MAFSKEKRRNKIKKSIRRSLSGTAAKPRLSVFRSNKEIYAQLIDDVDGRTLVSSSSKEKGLAGESKIETAGAVGKSVAQKAKDAGIEEIKFDRSGYLYHGRVKSLAEGAREGGLKF